MTQSSGSVRTAYLGSRRVTYAAVLVATGLVLFVFESLIPRPLPWLKPGLANVAGLIALYLLGMREAVAVTLVRILVGALLLGTFFNPAFFLSLGGGMMAVFAMGTVRYVAKDAFSIIGISVCGAACHNLVQMWLAYALIVRRMELFFLLPAMLLAAVVTGTVVGLIGHLAVTGALGRLSATGRANDGG
ncbi:MAG: Gx transporter family protein [candidate division KSB1 bacterium]|nr:Gx transporter family protein [candidate division KSB1 bacterium]MDZ7386363.1 Gx transporter family protein [candidate division KSB1 bacterium]MDZ7393996.1 Gx transporter family protein [candidate division KSB1 bacterium]MDZ7414080.1 Gx transporter family protein [candidate division KSB1 bacterium]